MCTFKQWRVVPLKIPQLSVSTNHRSLLVPSEHSSKHSQSLSNSIIIPSVTSSSHCSVTLQNNLHQLTSIDSVTYTNRILKGITTLRQDRLCSDTTIVTPPSNYPRFIELNNQSLSTIKRHHNLNHKNLIKQR